MTVAGPNRVNTEHDPSAFKWSAGGNQHIVNPYPISDEAGSILEDETATPITIQ
ncbi:MAG TPA: hypothetical protein VG167_14995 [Verrucomicrobiae bacterium]|nr:hypothetical protein [Verrucomicrobiae bacterium]